MIYAYDLLTEYLHNPMGIDINRPVVSWKVNDAIRQTAFELSYSVNGCEPVLTKQMTEKMVCRIDEEFSSMDIITWQVRLADENGNWGQWSEEARFEYGLLRHSDWVAKWIMGNYKHDPKGTVRYPADCFRTTFEVEGKVEKARLYITACGMYETKINGKRVGDFVLAPGSTDFRKRVHYQTYDVTDIFIQSSKEIDWTIELADGYYSSNCGVFEEKKPFGFEPKVLAQLEILFDDGNRKTIATDASFSWSNDGPVTYADMKQGEIVDFNLAPSYRGSARETRGQGKVCASNNYLIKEQEKFNPKSITKFEDGTVLIDFGQNIAGYVQFKVTGTKGHKSKLKFGEKLDENGLFTQSNLYAKEKKGSHFQTEQIICSGQEVVYKPRFTIMGFQYMLLVDWPEEVIAENFTAIAVYSDMESTFEFKSSNKELNKIIENTMWSVKGNFCDVPTDCPTRERAGWTGDAQLFFNTGNYMMDQRAFFRKWLNDVVDGQKEDGMVYNINPGPHSKGSLYEWLSIEGSSGWGDALITIPYYFWKRYGDDSLMNEFWSAMKKCYGYYYKRMGKRNLLSLNSPKRSKFDRYIVTAGRHFGEWTEPEDCTPGISALIFPAIEEATAYLGYCTILMEEMSKHLGYDQESNQYKETKEKLLEAYNYYFVQNGDFDSNRMCKYVRPLGLGLVTNKEIKEKLLGKIVELNKKRNYKIGTGFLSTPFFLSLMTEAGYSDEGFKTMMNPDFGWGQQIRNGATTIWENWTDDASLNHYSKGACCQWIFDTVCGIKLDGRNNHFVIEPNVLAEVDSICFSYKSVYGTVTSGWFHDGESVVYNITIPANCQAEVVIPGLDDMSLSAGKYTFQLGKKELYS